MNDVFSELKQYAIDRQDFIDIFEDMYDRWYELLINYESDDFKSWHYGDEYYILHKSSGTLINWYKHLGRTNTCNKTLTIDEYKKFIDMLVEDMKGSESNEYINDN